MTNKVRILIVILVILNLTSPIVEASSSVPPGLPSGVYGGSDVSGFGMKGPEDMPSVPGCSNTGNDEMLYYVGLTAGIDPVMLKVIYRKETTCGDGLKDNKNTNGTIDIGIMQINNDGMSGLGLDKNSEKDVNELRTNKVLNAWAATEIIKMKYNYASKLKGKNISGNVVKHDVFGIFWGYNGFSSMGHKYALDTHKMYVDATKLGKINRASVDERIYASLGLDILHANGKTVPLDKAITNTQSMAYEEFAIEIERISNGAIVPDKYETKQGLRDEFNETYYAEIQAIIDENKGTGLVGEETTGDMVTNYNVYKFVKIIATVMNYTITVIAMATLILLVIFWALYIMALSGVLGMGDLLRRLTRGAVNIYVEGSIGKMAWISLIVVVFVALAMTGSLSYILEKSVIGLMSIIHNIF